VLVWPRLRRRVDVVRAAGSTRHGSKKLTHCDFAETDVRDGGRADVIDARVVIEVHTDVLEQPLPVTKQDRHDDQMEVIDESC
jgi:hypothetical protein